MADQQQLISMPHQQQNQYQYQHQHQQISAKSVMVSSLAGVAIVGPLVGMMVFSFVATATVLIIASPLLLLFSPLLFLAGLLFVGVLAGLGSALAMAVIGVSTIAWSLRDMGLGQRVKEQWGDMGMGQKGKDQWGDALQDRSDDAGFKRG